MASYDNNDPLAAAKQAERDLNSYQAKTGGGKQDISGMFFFSSYFYFPHTPTNHTISRLFLIIIKSLKFWWICNIATESGVNTSVEDKFPGAKVTYGSAASGAGDNREIPVEEGGDVLGNGRYVQRNPWIPSLESRILNISSTDQLGWATLLFESLFCFAFKISFFFFFYGSKWTRK